MLSNRCLNHSEFIRESIVCGTPGHMVVMMTIDIPELPVEHSNRLSSVLLAIDITSQMSWTIYLSTKYLLLVGRQVGPE